MKYIPFVLALCASTSSAYAETPSAITLEEAVRATLQHNPQLAGYRFREQALDGEHQTAKLKPALRASMELENALGSGDFTGTDSAELTLSLGSVIELGGQRDSRIDVITARQQQLMYEQRIQTFDLLSGVTQRFILMVAAQEEIALSVETEMLARQTVGALQQQVQAGRSADAELLRAQAALTMATIQVQKAHQHLNTERLQLSLFWADITPDFQSAKADLYALSPIPSLTELRNGLATNPALELIAQEVRLRQAQRRQAEAAGKANIEWNAGVRHFEASDSTAVVLGMNMPLGSGRRNTGAVATARADEEGAIYQQDTAQVQLESEILRLHQEYTQASDEVQSLNKHVLPLLQQANKTTFDAFRHGRYSYLELNQAQRELLDAKSALINAAVRMHQTRIEIERITGSLTNQSVPGDEQIESLKEVNP